MGEARRRKKLGLPPRIKSRYIDNSDRFISWIPITNRQISKYPYAAPVTMAIGLFLLLVDWTPLN
tara:strand:+ start:394 stop:588 length:195 start_codon:yes stop_codon:yes gene_type:complete